MFWVFYGVKLFCVRVAFAILICVCASLVPSYGQAPTDCANTIPVCSNGSINESSNGSGINDFAFPGNAAGCLVSNEHQSVWLYVQIESGTTLGFDIIPNVPGEDYDFAVYGPNVTCTTLGQPIRCSYAAPSINGNTGMNGSNNDVSEGASGNGYVSDIDVTLGDSYYILVDNFSTSFQGFTLNWTGSGNLDCSITLPCPEVDLGPNSSLCDGESRVLGGITGPVDAYLWSTGETTATISVSDSGTYWQQVMRDSCVVSDSIHLSLASTPTVELGNDTILCEGSTLLLDASDPFATSYLWQDGYLSPLYTVSTPGTYTVEVYNNSCYGADEIEVDYNLLPDFDLGADTIICDGTSLQLDANSPFADVYEWQNGSYNSSLNVTSSGNYWAIASNTACVSGDTISVVFGDSPVFDLGDDVTLCEGSNITLNAFAPNGSNYLWQDNSTDFTLDVTTTGVYTSVVSNTECVSIDSVLVTFIAYPVFDLGADTILCLGDELVLDAFSSVATEHTWQDGSNADTFTVTVEGMYGVMVKNDFCPTKDSIYVEYREYPIFSLGPDTLLCHGTDYPIVIDGEGDYIYTWQDNSSDPSFTVTEQDVYYLAVENYCGVRYDTVTVLYGSCNCDFFFPTGFTPNGDGLNDTYYPFVDCDSMQSYSLEIFNRWGESLFASDNADNAWRVDATVQEYFMDAFVWIIEYKWTWLGKVMHRREKGHFTIVK